MRLLRTATLAAFAALVLSAAAHADTVPPFQGNDTGGIIASSLAAQVDAEALAVHHCAKYGKVANFTSRSRGYGTYSAFDCNYVPARYRAQFYEELYGERPLRVRY
ncbi:MAG TPA: hypothetical protein VNZ94_13645 [Xanthobacteraceae bacterium]|nr:hypothetical protein [Xanthobacteraceae bacterium]